MKKSTIYHLSAAVLLVLLFGFVWMHEYSQGISDETLLAAYAAADHDDEDTATQLVRDACEEGNAEACSVVREQGRPGAQAEQMRRLKEGCDSGGSQACHGASELAKLNWSAKPKK